MPKFDKSFKKAEVGVVSCLGKLQLGGRQGLGVRESKTGSGYCFVRLSGVPDPRTAGLGMSTNMMVHPDWLEEDFDPETLDVNPIEAAKAKNIAKQTKDEDLPDNVAEVLARNSQNFVYSRNIYSPNRPSLLQSILGSEFSAFATSVDNMSPEKFFKALQTAMESTTSDCFFIYEGSQSKDQDGELTNRMELTAIYRIENAEDLEKYVNALANRNVDMLWDPAAISG